MTWNAQAEAAFGWSRTDAIGRSKVLDLEFARIVLMGRANAGTSNKGQSQGQREIVCYAVGIQQRVRLDGSQIVHMIFFRRSGRQVRGGLMATFMSPASISVNSQATERGYSRGLGPRTRVREMAIGAPRAPRTSCFRDNSSQRFD